MPIRPFLQDDHSFGPEDIEKMTAAFEAALRELGLFDRNDPSLRRVHLRRRRLRLYSPEDPDFLTRKRNGSIVHNSLFFANPPKKPTEVLARPRLKIPHSYAAAAF